MKCGLRAVWFAAAALALSAGGDARAQATAWGYLGNAHPRFSVVYVDGPAPSGESLTLSIRDGRFHPAYAALGAGGRLTVHNRSDSSHTVVDPFDGIIRRLPPGERMEIDTSRPGGRSLFLMGTRGGAEATVFVSPGPYSIVEAGGRFELANLRAGRVKLHAWRPDAPPVFAWIQLRANQVQRFDIGPR